MSAVLDEITPTLPARWYWTTMGEIAEVIGGGTPRTNDPANFDGGDIPWITPADLSGYVEKYISHGARFITRRGLESSSARLLPAGTVLFTSRAPIGYVAIARNPVATNQGFKSFVLKAGVLPEYVYWWLKGSKQRAEALASGTTFLELSGANAKKLPIPIAPIDVQRRIVAEIEKQFSRLDEAVANLKRVKANLKRQTAAILSAAIGGQLIERPVFQADTDRPEFAPAIDLPSGWSWASAADVCDVVASGSTPKADEMTSGAGEIPFIKVYNLGFDGSLDFTVKPTFIRRAMHEGPLARSRCLPGDVLMNIVGPPLGKVSLVPDAFAEWNINQAIVTFRAGPRILNRLLAYWLMTPPVQRRIERTSKATAGQYNVQVSTCRKLVLPLPPLDEQHRIVAEVDRRRSIVREVEAEVDANLKRAHVLRQTVLAGQFSLL